MHGGRTRFVRGGGGWWGPTGFGYDTSRSTNLILIGGIVIIAVILIARR